MFKIALVTVAAATAMFMSSANARNALEFERISSSSCAIDGGRC